MNRLWDRAADLASRCAGSGFAGVEMPSALKDFLVDLAADLDLLSAFVADPEESMRSADLSPEERQILASGDQFRIYSSIAPESLGDPVAVRAMAAQREAARAPAGVHARPRVGPIYSARPRRARPAAADGSAAGSAPNLIVAGTGIRAVGQMTMESLAWMKRADRLLYVVGDPVAEALIHQLNPDGAESLSGHYRENRPRIEAYEEMVAKTLDYVRAGDLVCLVTYGHPGVFAYPTHESLRRALAEGYRAHMLPGVSAEDCLFADLNFDPAMGGCQSYEATDFLVHQRFFDPSSHLVLWQIGVLGNATFQSMRYEQRGMEHLLHRLVSVYGPHHPVCLYEAPMLPGVEPSVRQMALHMLPHAETQTITTLYVPPGAPPRADLALARSLGLPGY